MNILALESSCDETACSVIANGTEIRSNVVATSSSMHEQWGGIVPEVAARQQLSFILPVIKEALKPLQKNEKEHIRSVIEKNVDAIAVTVGPGLIGSLLIGIETAKALAFITKKPIIPVNHVLAHMYANFLHDPSCMVKNKKTKTKIQDPQTKTYEPILFPAMSLVVSGGHTELFLMRSEKDISWIGGTIDDAAGEAFDKSARLLGFGNKGGFAIQEAAARRAADVSPVFTIRLPRPLLHDETLNFSFSGLKTAIQREWNKHNEHANNLVCAFAYEIQESITDVLVKKTIQAAEMHGVRSILISGGVSSNIRLRQKFLHALSEKQNTMRFHCPPPSLCTDNAAFIGSYAYFRGIPSDWHTLTAIPDLRVSDI